MTLALGLSPDPAVPAAVLVSEPSYSSSALFFLTLGLSLVRVQYLHSKSGGSSRPALDPLPVLLSLTVVVAAQLVLFTGQRQVCLNSMAAFERQCREL